jgi:chromosome segregation ATPase
MRIQEDDCTDFANAIFCSSLERERSTMQSSEEIARCKKENELLSIKCKELNQMNTLLRDEIQTKEISFHHEFSKCRRQAQVDTLELTESCNGLQQQLSIAHTTLSQLKDEVSLQIESKLQSQKEVDKLKGEMLELEKTLQNNHIVYDELQKQLHEKSTEMDKASKEIYDLSSNLKESKCNEQELIEIHNDLKQRLEESLKYLISIVHIHSSKEEEHEIEYNIIKSQLQHVQMELDKANSHSSTVEEKYIALKQKYQELKKRFEKEKQKIVQDKNKLSEENSKKSIRKPMGTLAFMNSIHDTSLRLEKAKHSDGNISRSSINRSSSHTSRTREYDSSRKSKFRIVKY